MTSLAVLTLMSAIPIGLARGESPAAAGPDRGHEHYTIGLFGDMPYNALGRAQYPNLLADINESHERTLHLTRQSSEGGPFAEYAENVRWSLGPVVYIGLNVQGSNDNYPYAGVDGETRSAEEIDRQRAEEVARKAANVRWLHDGFAYASRVGAKGVMVIWQADPNFNNEEKLADPRSWDAYPAYVSALRDETMGFAGQVALVHGDGHYFKVDKPLNGPTGGVLANFTRSSSSTIR